MVHNKTKKSPFKFFLIIIIVIMVITVIVDLLSNEQALSIPGNVGILDLSSCQNYLAALTKDNQVYLWDWKALSGDPDKRGICVYPAVILDPERIMYYDSDTNNALMVKHLATDDNLAEFPLSSDCRLIHIGATRDRNILAVLLKHISKNNDDLSNVYQLATIHPETNRYRTIVNIGSEAMDYQLYFCTISDNGEWGIMLGSRQGQGVITVIDVAQRKIAREINIPGVKLFDHADFEPAGAWFFAGGNNMVLYQIQTDTGQIISHIPVDDNFVGAASRTAFRDIAVSPDGKMVAALTTTYKGGVWDCVSGENLSKSIFLKKVAATVAFSPDSRLLATGPLQDGGQISIIRLPK